MQEQTPTPIPEEESQDDDHYDEEDNDTGVVVVNGLYQLCLEGNLERLRQEIAEVNDINETDEDDYTHP